MTKLTLTYRLNTIDRAVAFLKENIGFGDVLAVDGPMGSGKTTLIKALLFDLETEDTVSSPTFSIVNSYQTKNGMVHHFDLYRLESVQELTDLGFDMYIDNMSLVLIEWPELAKALLPQNAINLRIEVNPDDSRRLTIER